MLYKILVFDSAHRVMKAEKILLSEHYRLEIIPTPKEITSDCGLSIRVNPRNVDIESMLKLLSEQKLKFRIFEKDMI